MVSRGQDHCPTPAEVVDDGDAQGSALRGVGPRPDFVEKDESRTIELPGHLDDHREMGGERGEVLGDGLVVANIGVHAAENGQTTARGRGDVHSGLGHEGEQPHRLERDGLASGVGPGDDQHPFAGLGAKAHRNGLRVPCDSQALGDGGHEEGVTAVDEGQVLLLDHLRCLGVHVFRDQGHGLCGVELPEDRRHLHQVLRAVSGPGRQILEDAHDLTPLLVLQRHDVVVELHGGERLDEQARPGARAAVDDPGQLALVVGLQEKDVPVVPGRDDPVLKQPLGLPGVKVPLHHGGELGPQAGQGAPGLGELRRGVVRHLSGGPDRLADRRGDLRGVPGRRGQAREQRCVVGPADGTDDLEAPFDERGQVQKPPRLEVGALDPGPGQGRGGIGEIVIGLSSQRLQEAPRLAGPGQGLPNGLGIGERLQAQEARPSWDRPRPLGDQGPHAVELEHAKSVSVQLFTDFSREGNP